MEEQRIEFFRKKPDETLSVKSALSKAHSKISVERAAIDALKRNFNAALNAIKAKPQESEEFLKNLISDFLKNTWYAPDYFINTAGRYDLVIHGGKSPEDPIAVILETKSLRNKAEMISPAHLNGKAMQELLLYYLRETIDNKNPGLKHLIITNGLEWYIFDAQDFYRLFSLDKELLALYAEFTGKNLLGKDTGFFYNQIAFPFIKKREKELPFAYLNILGYEAILRGNDAEADNRLIGLYKILSPEHLLKLPFANDSNSLNQNFYAELLYIMGLREKNENGKKIIVRNEPENRMPASLIENIIFQKAEDIADEDALFDIALESSITWINRILFLKLLEAQQLRYQGGDRAYAFLNIQTVKTFNELNALFFKALAVRPENREASLKEKYKNVPYLNSSLFEKTFNENNHILISNLQNEELAFFPSTVLKDGGGGKRRGGLAVLEYIFAFLDAYDFSSEGHEEIQEEKKTLINASVLGLIFEKINGYKDGSFFTPGFITAYMCRETIRGAVIHKFNEAKGWNAETLEDIYNNINDIAEANRIIDSIAICDPAVGSGHFLVSALNEIIAVKSELGLLCDGNGKRLKSHTAEIVNDELVLFDEDHTVYAYNVKNAESRRAQETIFQEKRRIIENCLFGVDINPNSVKICRLRLWIELLKNAYYTAESGYTELETLPNIDINIKSGNSLISRYDIRSSLKTGAYSIEEYKKAADGYKNSSDKKGRERFLKNITAMKTSYAEDLKQSNRLFLEKISLEKKLGELGALGTEMGFVSAELLAEKAKQVKKIEAALSENKAKIDAFLSGGLYADAFEWRFEFPEALDADGGFIGFDAVIGNPPYISAPAMVEGHPQLREAIVDSQRFSALYQKWDLYIPFMELGLQLLAPNGIFAMIVPYPFTNQIYAKKMRELIVSHYNFIEIVDLNGTKVFENATVSNCIPFIQKSPPQKSCFVSHINEQKQIKRSFSKLFTGLAQDEKTAVWNLTAEKREANRHSEMNVLGDFCYISVGMVLNSDEKTAKGQFTKEDLISETSDKIHCRKYIEAKDIERYRVKRIRYLEYNTERCPGQLRRPTFREFYEHPKLLINAIGNMTCFFDNDTKYLHNHSLTGAVLWKDLKGVDNKSISASVKRYSRFSRTEMEGFSEQIDLRYALGILNSKYASVLLTNIRGGGLSIYPEHLRNLPIPFAAPSEQEKVIALAEKILAAKAADPQADTQAWEKNIDALAYALYGLTEAEIQAVEGRP